MSTQEMKESQYKTYDWTQNEKWQSYLNGVYPIPPMARLEKIKRRWYKNNIDKQFDVDFTVGASTTTSQGSSAGTANTNATGVNQGAQPQYNQYNPFFSGAMEPKPDVKPEFKGPQFVAWIFFLVCFCTGIISSTFVGLIALLTGVIRKGGFPQMNIDYFQMVVLDENV